MLFGRGQGPGSGGGRGAGRGSGRGSKNGGRGMGRGSGYGLGPGGNCVCPECGHKVPHQRGVPCYEMKCPNCGGQMVHEGLDVSGSPDRNNENMVNTPVIDENKCIGCGNCVVACPFKAIKIENGVAKIMSDKCRNCRKCVRVCPKSAIK